MTAEAESAIATHLGALVREQPGVIAVYRSGQPVERTIAKVADALLTGRGDGPEPIVKVRGGRVTVTAAIGVETESAAQTCRAVHDRIAEWLDSRGHHDHAIIVTIAYVTS